MTGYILEEHIGMCIKVTHNNDVSFTNQNRINKVQCTYQTDTSGDVEYRFNPQGFRSDNDYQEIIYNNEPYICVYGCSHTEGVGTPIELTYGEILGKMLGLKVINFALTSASDTWATWMYYYHNNHCDLTSIQGRNTPVYNIMLRPPSGRFMINNSRNLSFFQDWNWAAHDGTLSYYENISDGLDKYHVIDSYNPIEESKFGSQPFETTHKLNEMMTNSIIKSEGIIELDWKHIGLPYPDGPWELALDDVHFGESWHKEIANQFYLKIKNGK